MDCRCPWSNREVHAGFRTSKTRPSAAPAHRLPIHISAISSPLKTPSYPARAALSASGRVAKERRRRRWRPGVLASAP